jgi:hypothetical protein
LASCTARKLRAGPPDAAIAAQNRSKLSTLFVWTRAVVMGVTPSLVKAMGLGPPVVPSAMVATLCTHHCRCDIRAVLRTLTGVKDASQLVAAELVDAMQVMMDTHLVVATMGVAAGPLGPDAHTRPWDAAASAALEVPFWDAATAADLAAAAAPVTPDSHLLVQVHVPPCACHPTSTRTVTASVALTHLLDLPLRVRDRHTTPDVVGFLPTDLVIPGVVRLALGDSNPAKDMPPTVSFHAVHLVVTAGVSANGNPTLMFALSNPVAGGPAQEDVVKLTNAMGFSAMVVPGVLGYVLGTWRCAMLGHRRAGGEEPVDPAADEYVEVDELAAGYTSEAPGCVCAAGPDCPVRIAVGRCAACAGYTDASLAASQYQHLFRLVGQAMAARRGWTKLERTAMANTFLRTVLSPREYDAAVAAGASCFVAIKQEAPAGKPSRGRGAAKKVRVFYGVK